MTQQSLNFEKPIEKSSIDFLIKSIEKGIPLLTVNVRLSRYLGAIYDTKMKEHGHKMWETPSILPLSSWIKEFWDESWPNEALISAERSAVLWEEIIAADESLCEKKILFKARCVKNGI